MLKLFHCFNRSILILTADKTTLNMDGSFFYKVRQLDIAKFAKLEVFLSRPRIIGLYEYNITNFTPAKRLKYLKELTHTDYPLNLNEGNEDIEFDKSEPQQTRLHIPLYYAMSPAATIAITNDGMELSPVYTSRRVLTQLMESYITRYDFAIDVSHFNGTLFMAGVPLELAQNIQGHHLRLEQVLFSDSPLESPEKNKPFDKNVGLSALHRTTLGKYDLIYAGEVQGVIAEEEFNKFDDLEAVNQLRFVFSKQLMYTNKKDWKFLTYWLQSYLANVDDIYIAYKNFKGIVENPLEHIKVSDIPKNCTSWKPQVCVGVLHEFLEKVKQLMANVNSLDTVYTFYFNAKEQIFYYKKHEGKTEKSFIPQDYAKFVAKNLD